MPRKRLSLPLNDYGAISAPFCLLDGLLVSQRNLSTGREASVSVGFAVRGRENSPRDSTLNDGVAEQMVPCSHVAYDDRLTPLIHRA